MTGVRRGYTLVVTRCVRVTRAGCWMWEGPRSAAGQPVVAILGILMPADAVVYASYFSRGAR